MTGIEALLQDIDGLSLVTAGLVLFAGLVVGIAPSSFPLIAVAAGLGARKGAGSEADNSRAGGSVLPVGFVLGIVTVDILIGALFGFAGLAVMRVLNAVLAYVYALLAAVLALTGLALWRILRIRLPVLHPGAGSARTFLGAYILGLPFGLSTCPACTPMVLPVVIAASSTADPLLGAVLMGVFGLGRSFPLVIAGTSAANFVQHRHSRLIVRWAERLGGLLLISAAVYFTWQAGRYAGWL